MPRKFGIISAKTIVNRKLIVRLRTCKFQPKLKGGMTASEANNAIDTAMEAFITCLKSKGKL
jgi:hypothetical protein